MTDLTRAPSLNLLERTRDLATLSEDELRRLAAEAARDRDAEALWALLEAHLTLHGSAGSRVSRHTLEAYRQGLNDLLKAWQGENLLRPRRNAGVLYVLQLEGKLKLASVGGGRQGALCCAQMVGSNRHGSFRRRSGCRR